MSPFCPRPTVRLPRHRAEFRRRRSARGRPVPRALRYLVEKALGAAVSMGFSLMMTAAIGAFGL